MKYILLAYTNSAGWEAEAAAMQSSGEMSAQVKAACEFYDRQLKELKESGEFVYTAGLPDPSHTISVSRREGVPVTTDGPFAESKEALVSFCVVDVVSHDRAVEIAAQTVAAIGDTIEVRPLYDQDSGYDPASGEALNP